MDDDLLVRTELAPCPLESCSRVDGDRPTRSEGRSPEVRCIPPCPGWRTSTPRVSRTMFERPRSMRCRRCAHSRRHKQHEHQWQQHQDCVGQPSSDTTVCSPQDGPPASKEPLHGYAKGRTTPVLRPTACPRVLRSPFPGGSDGLVAEPYREARRSRQTTAPAGTRHSGETGVKTSALASLVDVDRPPPVDAPPCAATEPGRTPFLL
jgi:hypothetical protein